jgi:hypothetical protein
MVFLSSL